MLTIFQELLQGLFRFCLIHTITLKGKYITYLSLHHKSPSNLANIYYLAIVSEGQETRSCLAEWFWVGVSHEVVVKGLAGVTVT